MEIRTSRPILPSAFIAFALAVVAAVAAVYGVTPQAGMLNFPMITRPPSADRGTAIYGIAIVVPIVLGLAAFVFAVTAFRRAERSSGSVGGQGPAVFAMMIGMFAITTASVSAFVVFGYARLPGS